MLSDDYSSSAAQLSLQSLTSQYEKQHANPQGPGDARPTAMQVIHDNDKAAESFSDKVILITGCSSGIGVETARALYATGAKLFVTVRDVTKGEKVIDDILENARNITMRKKQEIELIEMHMDSLESVREAARQVQAKTDRLNVVVNNAGMKKFHCQESHLGINYCNKTNKGTQVSWPPHLPSQKTGSNSNSPSIISPISSSSMNSSLSYCTLQRPTITHASSISHLSVTATLPFTWTT